MIILGCLKKLNIYGAEPFGTGKARDTTTGKENVLICIRRLQMSV